MSYNFQKAVDYLDRMPYWTWTFDSFVQANEIAGSPFTHDRLKMMWDTCAAAGKEGQAVLLMETFRQMASKHQSTTPR